jgi:hypothetical protein
VFLDSNKIKYYSLSNAKKLSSLKYDALYFCEFNDVSVKLAVFTFGVYPDKSPDDGGNKLW